MFCKQCGAQIPDGSPFCTSCGSPVSVKQSAAQPQANQNPYAQQPQAQPAQNPYAQQPQTQPAQNPYAQQPQAQPAQNPYAQQPQAQPAQNPYAQQPQAQPAQNPYAQQPQAQPVQNSYEQQNNGKPVQYGAVQTAVAKAPMSPEKKKKIILFSAIGGGVLIIVVALILVFSFIGKDANSSCINAINTYNNSIAKGNIDEYMSVIPPDVVSYTVEHSYYGDYSAFKEHIEDLLDSYSYSLPVQIRSEVIDEKHCLDSETLLNITEKYCDRYEASARITDIAKCKVRTYITYDNIGTPSTDTETTYLIQIDGKWYIDNNGLCSSISSSKFH